MDSTLRNTARVYKNAVSSEVVRLERRPGGAKFEELRELVSGARGRKVYEDGDPEAGVWSWVSNHLSYHPSHSVEKADNSAGISIGLIDDIPTCEVLVARIVSEAESEINRMSGLMRVAGADEAWKRSQRTREAKLWTRERSQHVASHYHCTLRCEHVFYEVELRVPQARSRRVYG